MTVSELLKYTKQTLCDNNINDYEYDALYLVEYAFGMTKTELMIYGEKTADEQSVSLINDCIRRRINGEPVQYIIGEWDFMGLPYYVGTGVLIPRADTEVLVNSCVDLIQSKNSRIIDLCSGSGIIAVTLKNIFPEAEVYAVEKSDDALKYLEKNCERNNADVNILHSDISLCHSEFDDGYFDVIVSNPPYIVHGDICSLQKEISYEPDMALDGGLDGYDFYRIIISCWSKKLRLGGLLALEIGEGQFDCISELLIKNGYCNIKAYYDLSNTIRAVTAVYKANS